MRYMDNMLNDIIGRAKELNDLYQCVVSNEKLQSWSQKAVKLMENLQLYRLWHDTCKGYVKETN